jgi:hypothetical protein
MPINPKGIYIGFDPGGDGKFGVALLDGDCVSTFNVGTVDGAMECADHDCLLRPGLIHSCIGQPPRAVCVPAMCDFGTSIGM